jgi:D-alanyl-D-alanine carboxypeptidase
MDLCDIDRSLESFGGKKNPDKEMLSNRLIEWLEEPKASGKKLKGTSKKKRKASSTAVAKAPKKPAAKETKKEASKPKKKKKKTVEPADDGDVELNIPGVSTDSIRSKIESIVSNADKESVTVKDVRKKLEEWLDMDLVEHKEGIRAMVMDAM